MSESPWRDDSNGYQQHTVFMEKNVKSSVHYHQIPTISLTSLFIYTPPNPTSI